MEEGNSKSCSQGESAVPGSNQSVMGHALNGFGEEESPASSEVLGMGREAVGGSQSESVSSG